MLYVINNRRYQDLGSPTTVARKDAPKIRDPKQVRDVLQASGATNLSSVNNALNLNYAVFFETGAVRNFYAHRNDDTFRRAANFARSQLGLSPLRHVDDVLNTNRPRRPVPLIEDSLAELHQFFVEITT